MNQELHVIVMPDGALTLEWVGATGSVSKNTQLLQKEIFRRYDFDKDDWLLFAAFSDNKIPLSPSLDYWRGFAGAFARRLSRTPDLETLRHKVKVEPDADALNQILESAPPMTGAEYLNVDLLESVWQRLNSFFSAAVQSYEGTVAAFIGEYSPDVHLVGRVFFHLVENKDNNLPFAFLATYSTRLGKEGKSKHLPLKYALEEYGRDSRKMLELLATVHAAAGKSPLIAELVESGELFHPQAWTAGEAFTFLKEVPLYEDSGVLCRIPNWWKATGAGIRLDIRVGDKAPAYLGMDAILSFDPRLLLGEMEISEAEAVRLLDQAEGLAFIKNKWVEVDPEKLKQVLDAYRNAKKLMSGGLTLKDAMRLQLHPEKLFKEAENEAQISNGQWLASVLQKLHQPGEIAPVAPGKGFAAELRPYQQKGLNWLHYLHSLNLGACLADDMGLGKTVQVLGLLSAVKADLKKKASQKASLLIVPASLISNWMTEIKRFSPALTYLVAHPNERPTRAAGLLEPSAFDAVDLVITTYAMAQKYEALQQYQWMYIVLDEAQAIKNPGAMQTRAVKKLTAVNRIIMTGTPIENRLSDLWSLFDFLNPGLLGTSKEFTAFSKSIKNDARGYARLRKIISPYILRRMKTDKTIISDLPDKVEMKTYAGLSKKQIVLYRGLIDSIAGQLEESDGIQRKGLILASLMKFKQICNHPDQYAGSGDFKEKDSGKFERLKAICETIYEKREKVLVFTQFKEMTEPISDFLASVFHRKGLILHGSIPVGKRKNIIEKFQDKAYIPYMVLSLKAGGVGLNLTEANHVIHFDRWWNPAVENQATDRAFRIGQKKNVIVHKFLTKGTVEEKIDRMLEEKSRLSEEIVSKSGEKWITEMQNDELMALFQLSL